MNIFLKYYLPNKVIKRTNLILFEKCFSSSESNQPKEEENDEFSELNKMLKNAIENKDKKNRRNIIDEAEEEKPEEDKLKKIMKKLSQAELVTIQKDEDINKYDLTPQTEESTDKILSTIFEKKINKKFYKNLDKVFKEVEVEEINLWERLGSAKILTEIEIEDKDLSDIEENVRDIKDDITDSEMTEITQEVNDLSKFIDQFVKKEEKIEKLLESEFAPSFEVKKYSSLDYFQNYKNSLTHLQLILNNFPILVNKQVDEDNTYNEYKSIPSKPYEYDKTKQTNEDLTRLTVLSLTEAVIKQSFNLFNGNINDIFQAYKKDLYDALPTLNPKVQKFVLKNNLPKYLDNHYTIKTFIDKIAIKLFKTTIINFNRKSIEYVFKYIKETNSQTVNIVYNTKRDIKTKNNYGVIMIFAEGENILNMSTNFGPLQGISTADMLLSFICMVLIDLIQMNLSSMIKFNLLMAKKFNLEFKMTSNTKNIPNLILANLMEAKFQKLKIKSSSHNNIIDITESDNAYFIKNFKFFSQPKSYVKDSKLLFDLAAKLEIGEICYKI